MSKGLLIIMVRNPVLGKVKTRLAASIGPARALEIYHKLLEKTSKITRELPVDKVVFYSEFIDEDDLWDPEVYQTQIQAPGDLGERIATAFNWGFNSGYRNICVIGSDCYELSSTIIEEGFTTLEDHDAVLGPSRDGGYYLLGINQMHPELFRHKDWGTDSVAVDTMADFKSLGLTYGLLRPLNDIDEESDLNDLPL